MLERANEGHCQTAAVLKHTDVFQVAGRWDVEFEQGIGDLPFESAKTFTYYHFML